MLGTAGGTHWDQADTFLYPQVYAVDPRNWDHKNWPKLGVGSSKTFGPWFNRAHRWLHGGAPAMKRLLEYLQFEAQPLTPARERQLALQANLPYDWEVADVSRVMAEAIVRVSLDSVAALSQRIGEGRGMELYRDLYARFRGAGPMHAQAGIEAIMNPRRCKSTADLRESLAEMERDSSGRSSAMALTTPNPR